jgi:pyrroloquinoline quinone biosynthesis protein E
MVGQSLVEELILAEEVTREAPTAPRIVAVGPPLGMLAELTHRCPLQCPYCSNPIQLHKANEELTTEEWLGVFDAAAGLGVLQVHLSGGEPTLRPDLEQFVARLARHGIYSNLITAGVSLSRDRVFALRDSGLDHLQLSVQSVREPVAEKIGHYKGALAKKRQLTEWVREAGLPLTINAPVHRHNIEETADVIQFALDVGAERLEVANTQYYGWAAINKAALMPSYEAVIRQAGIVTEARARLKGVLNIDYVTPDYYARYPKPCMGGWAKDALNVTPSGRVLPCHAAESITELCFENVRETPLEQIWYASDAFNRFRGTDWMQEPCQSCERKLVDFGGCRCQAFALTGDARATDPACILSPHHTSMKDTADALSAQQPPEFRYRRIGRA